MTIQIADKGLIAAYRLTKALNHLKKAQYLLEDLNLINQKVDGDFFSLLDFCTAKITELKNLKDVA
jgi:hypothetical protein